MAEISVVIPTFNRARHVCDAVRSALSQTRPPQEIIVVDDGSTDDTVAALGQFGCDVRLVQQRNKGGAAARNLGVSRAVHPWIAFLDSDDIWEPDHLGRMVAAIEATEGKADLYFDDYLRKSRDAGGRTKWEGAGFFPRVPYEVAEDGAAWVLMEDHPMLLPTSVVRTDAFRAAGGFREDFRTAHDSHFLMKLCIGHAVCAVAGLGARQGAGGSGTVQLTSRTGPLRDDRRRNVVRLTADILERYPHLSPGFRSVLRERLASAHWQLSRIAWTNRAYGNWVEEAVSAILIDPGGVARRVAARARKPSAKTRIDQDR